MELAYQICAVVGGTIIVCQFIMTLLGLGGDHGGADDGGGVDVAGHEVGGHDAGGGHDHGHAGHHGTDHGDHNVEHGTANWFFGLLTFRTIVAGLAFFGLTGLLLTEAEFAPGLAFAIALAVGMSALVGVGYLMSSLSRLNADGTARIGRSVGALGTVYLRVPGGRAGAGKVHVSVHGRLLEYKAITTGPEGLPTGSRVVVVGVVGPDTIEVTPVPASEEAPHV